MAVYKAGRRDREPTHPGALLRRSLAALGVSVRKAALAMGVTPQSLGAVANEEAAVSPQMALLLGRYLGNGPELWLGLQADVDLWRARQAIRRKLEKVKPAPRP